MVCSRYLGIEIPVIFTFDRKISQAAIEEIVVGHKGKKQILTLNDESDRHLKKKENNR